MKPIPDIVKEYVIEMCGRMPQTDKEIDEYLDLINHAKKYSEAVEMEQFMSKKFMKIFGFKTSDEVKKEFNLKD